MFVLHLVAVGLAALAVWLTRHEIEETAATRLDWVLPAALALAVAAILIGVSPGKRVALWTITIGAGVLLGLGAGLLVKSEKDFAHNLLRIRRAWDGIAAAAALACLALVRFVSSDLLGRHSVGFGVLAAAAAFLATYLTMRLVTLRLAARWRAPYADMARGDRWRPS